MGDQSALQRVEQVLAEAGVEMSGLAEKILAEAGEPDRRKMMSRTESAFREGFLVGKRWPKFAPYAADIWRKSDFYARYFGKKATGSAAEERFAKYNDLG